MKATKHRNQDSHYDQYCMHCCPSPSRINHLRTIRRPAITYLVLFSEGLVIRYMLAHSRIPPTHYVLECRRGFISTSTCRNGIWEAAVWLKRTNKEGFHAVKKREWRGGVRLCRREMDGERRGRKGVEEAGGQLGLQGRGQPSGKIMRGCLLSVMISKVGRE